MDRLTSPSIGFQLLEVERYPHEEERPVIPIKKLQFPWAGSNSYKKSSKTNLPSRKLSQVDTDYLYLFAIMCCVPLIILVYGLFRGDPQRYISEYDSWGNVCGRKSNAKYPGVSLSGTDQSNRTFVFRTGLSNIRAGLNPTAYLYSHTFPATSICVYRCPTTNVTNCEEFIKENGYFLPDPFVKKHVCVMPLDIIFPHYSEINRCIPKKLLEISNNYSGKSYRTLWDNIYPFDEETIEESYKPEKYLGEDIRRITLVFPTYSVNFTLFSFFLCVVLLFILRYSKLIFLSCVIIIYVSASAVFIVELWGIYIFNNGKYIEDYQLTAVEGPEAASKELIKYVGERLKGALLYSDTDRRDLPNTTLENVSVENSTVYVYHTTELFSLLTVDGLPALDLLLIFQIVVALITWKQTISVLIHRKSFLFLFGIFKAATHEILNMPFLFLHSAITFVSFIILIVVTTSILVYIMTVSSPVTDSRGFAPFEIINLDFIQFLIVALVTFFIWWWHFIATCGNYILAHNVFTYVSSNVGSEEKRIGHRTKTYITNPIKDLLKYHIGTLILASVIVPICEQNKRLLKFVLKKLKHYIRKPPKRIVDKLEFCSFHGNRFAVFCTVIYGLSFSESARKGYALIYNHNRVLIKLSDKICLFIYVLKCCIVMGTLAFVFGYFKFLFIPHELPYEFPVMYWYVSLLSLSLAQSVFSIYGTVLHTLIICYCDDLKRNNGKNTSYYVSSRFRNSVFYSLMQEMTDIPNSTNQVVPRAKSIIPMNKSSNMYTKIKALNDFEMPSQREVLINTTLQMPASSSLSLLRNEEVDINQNRFLSSTSRSPNLSKTNL